MKPFVSFKIIVLLITVTGIISATIPSQSKYKNLKILPKNISEAELDSIMDDYKIALGVRCNFCHTRDKAADKFDFASEDKPEKQIARKMMTMTSSINRKYFNFNNEKNAVQAVTCITCHRSKPRPELDSLSLIRSE